MLLLKKPDAVFPAALTVSGDNTREALYIERNWPEDPEVQQYIQDIRDELGDEHFLASKAETARKVWELATTSEGMSPDDRLRAYRLYADIRGYIDKGPAGMNLNILTTDKVMVVKDHGADDVWEHKLLEQQTKLIDAANAPRIN